MSRSPTTSKDSRPLLSPEILVLLGKAMTLARLLHIRKKMVRSSGFEPPRYCYRQPLKLVRLPVPPRPHVGDNDSLTAAEKGCKPSHRRQSAPVYLTGMSSGSLWDLVERVTPAQSRDCRQEGGAATIRCRTARRAATAMVSSVAPGAARKVRVAMRQAPCSTPEGCRAARKTVAQARRGSWLASSWERAWMSVATPNRLARRLCPCESSGPA